MDNYIDQFRYANKELKETKRELAYQQIFAQAAFELYDEQTQVSHSLMVLKGIHVDLLSELLKFERKQPAPAARERVEILGKHLDLLSKLQTDNYALNWNNGKMRQEIWKLKQENADLKHRLHLSTCNENEMGENR